VQLLSERKLNLLRDLLDSALKQRRTPFRRLRHAAGADLFAILVGDALTRKLTPPIQLEDGRQLETLADVRKLMLSLPESRLQNGTGSMLASF
jgi:hypothetical protein